HTNDVAPFIDLAHNRTMIPVRAVSDALGAEIDWIAQTGTVQIYTDAGMHQLTAGSPLPDGMGVPVSLQGRVFVPIRYVAEVLGATVRWDEVNSAVYIYQ
ncbi:MAG: copper amine oxidase N-terminal domain-containing protein, partial [Defluviitaleaceae bacterium]|nr:copper amine oxidase N-terminal domain-containing protein [Defluviitaleaceae bacterium]